MYTYANSNPTAYIDISGEKPKKKKRKRKPKTPERRHGEKQQRRFRKKNRMKGRVDQAAHLATVRDAIKSKIPTWLWDQAPMMQLHSSTTDLGLHATVIDDDTATDLTRHNAQERVSDELTENSRKVQGKVTPGAQYENARQQKWMFENTPMDSRDIAKLRESGLTKFGKTLAKLGPLGTAIGIGTAVLLLAQGEPLAAIRELAGALPIIGDILDIIDLGSSIWGFFSGSGSKSSNNISDAEINEILDKSAIVDENLLLILLSDASESSSEKSSESSTASEGAQPRLVDVDGITYQLRLGSGGNGTALLKGPGAPEAWQWDEYLILDVGLGIKAKPTTKGLTLQLDF